MAGDESFEGDHTVAGDDTLGTRAGEHTLEGASASASHRRLRRSEEVGRYVVLDELGAGGMGIVYAAYDPELDRKIALKLLHDHVGVTSTSRASEGHRRLIREAQAMAKLNHPNVVTVYDAGEHRGRVYVAMEFIEGVTLARWPALAMRPSRLPRACSRRPASCWRARCGRPQALATWAAEIGLEHGE